MLRLREYPYRLGARYPRIQDTFVPWQVYERVRTYLAARNDIRDVYVGPASLLGTLNYILLLGKNPLPPDVETEVRRLILEPEGATEELPNDEDLRDIALAWNFII